MRNFSGLTYTIHDSTPIIYGNTYNPNDFITHIGIGALHGAFNGGGVGAVTGAYTGGPAGALSGGAVGGLLTGGLWAFGEKA
ncbi:hypothetical protein [Bartonella sp. B1098]|uniref:hypothetical protein n=1 Tax=Bartonella sp. B1098 TaxID=2911421 RepID=UPI0020C232B8|nr:hypothetical protein [Bartonella sp. B1098]